MVSGCFNHFATLPLGHSATSTLAYRLFLDPINLHTHWYVLLLPLALFMSIAYKSVRVSELKHLPRAVGVMTIQVCFWMAVLGLAGYLFVQYLAPLIAPK